MNESHDMMLTVDNFRAVHEEVTAFDLPVTGAIPEQLTGRLLRNGPNPVDGVATSIVEWLVGDGMVHGVRLERGQAVWFRNRFVGSTAMGERRGGPDLPGRNWNAAPRGPNTNVFGFAGRTLACVEAGSVPVALSYELDSVERHDFGGSLPNGFTGHPKLDPDTGEIHAMAYAIGLDVVQYIVIGTDGRVRRLVEIPLPVVPMIHDMSITEHYAVIYDQAVTFNLERAMAGGSPVMWNPDKGSRLGFLPREGDVGDIIWVDAPLRHSFHPMNAFERDDGTVVIDHCVYDTQFHTDALGLFGDGHARLERWEVNLHARTVSTQVIDEMSSELPRHRDSLNGKPYRYGYCASFSTGPTWPTLKYDLVTGERQVFDHGPGRAGAEPNFVSRPDPSAEDDGWLLTYVHDAYNATSELVIFDAQDFEHGYIAQVRLPQRVPHGFHGNWIDDELVAPSLDW